MFLFTDLDRPDSVQSALRHASRSTGVDFDYLLATAQRESNLDPKARAPTSTASGLFQFIESTWLATLKQAGPRHGYGDLAERIERTGQGRYRVTDAGARGEILALRHDPTAAALMAGELTRSNGESLQQALGRRPSQGELYIAHFLGAQGAAELIRMVETAPQSPAAAHFPAAAKANRSIFHTGEGQPRAAREVYANLIARHSATGSSAPAPAGLPKDPASHFQPARTQDGPVFHALFSDRGAGFGLGPIARTVGAFWSGLFTTPAEPAPAATAHVEEAQAATAYAPASPARRAVESAMPAQPEQGAAAAPAKPWRWQDPALPAP